MLRGGKKWEVLGRLEHWNRRMSKPICLPGLKTPTVKQVCHWSAFHHLSICLPFFRPFVYLLICGIPLRICPSLYVFQAICLSSRLSIYMPVHLTAGPCAYCSSVFLSVHLLAYLSENSVCLSTHDTWA